MADRQLMERIRDALLRLNQPIDVLDLTELKPEVRHQLETYETGTPVRIGESLMLRLKEAQVCLCCSSAVKESTDMLLLASAIIETVHSMQWKTLTDEDVVVRYLKGDASLQEIAGALRRMGVSEKHRHSVMVIKNEQVTDEQWYAEAKEIIPLEEGDAVVSVDAETIVVIKDDEAIESVDELTQYGQALQETILGETGMTVQIGISAEHEGNDELQDAYKEAWISIRLGTRFQAENVVHAYDQLLLERILADVPQVTAEALCKRVFCKENRKLFNREMLETVSMFFKKDLNLSDTARQLYVHRNTLVYRLDKIQSQTGLDLRSFRDAVIFCILMTLENDMAGQKNDGRE